MLSIPEDVEDVSGSGMRDTVAGRVVAVGKAAWVAPPADPRWAASIRREEGYFSLLDEPIEPVSRSSMDGTAVTAGS